MKQYIIDRFEGTFAVLEGSGGKMRDVLKSCLPMGAKQGDVLTETNGIFSVDAAATKRRAEAIAEQMNDLFN
ncbi:DUF3006 domain-containing protein [Ethanoligenens sp.]|uniref:DUF3006 domain-containing protein n=1 Tax=Ethanoligenens sp. TaxID=2099655 RepID=UPI0039EA539C